MISSLVALDIGGEQPHMQPAITKTLDYLLNPVASVSFALDERKVFYSFPQAALDSELMMNSSM